MTFLNILSQRQYNIKTSPMIEIIRFLSIFPSKRTDMIQELSTLKSSSCYNRFIIYFFLKYLKSMTSVSDEKNTQFLDDLQRSFLVHHHIYWKSREQKKYFKSFIEACSTSYYFIEMKYELMGLIERFPFDSYLYSRCADFSLIGCGDFELYRKSKIISSDLEKDKSLITDPILHQVVKNNVRILQFCNQEEIQVSKPVHNSNSSSGKSMPIASYLKKSRRIIPFFPFFHVILSIILFLIFFSLSIPFEMHSLNEYKNINRQSSILQLLYMKTFSSVFYPYAIHESVQDDLSTTHESKACQMLLDNIYIYISNFYLRIPQIQIFNDYTFQFFQKYYYENMINNKSVCQCLNNLTCAFDVMLNAFLNDLHDHLQLMVNTMLNLEDRIKQEKKKFYKEIIGASIAIFFIIIFIIILIIQVNLVFQKNSNVIKFFASKKRITALLLEQCIDSWEDLCNYIQPKKLRFLSAHSNDSKLKKMAQISLASKFSIDSPFFTAEDVDYSSFYEDSTSTTASQSNTDQSQSSNSKIKRLNGNDQYSTSQSSSTFNENEAPETLVTNVFANKNQQNYEDVNVLKLKSINYLESNNNGNEILEEYINNNQSNDSIGMEVDEDPIDLTIEATMQQQKFVWLTIPICHILPWIVILIIIPLLLIPFFFRIRSESKLINDYLNSCYQINQSFNLIENTLSILRDSNSYSSLAYDIIYNSIAELETNITQIFHRYQCFQLQDMVCSSYSDLIVEIVSNQPTSQQILARFLPAFVDFGLNAIHVTFTHAAYPYLKVLTTSIFSFYADFIFLSMFLIYFSLFFGNMMIQSFNSLYHFPEIFLNKKNKKGISNDKHNYYHPKKSKNHKNDFNDDEMLADFNSNNNIGAIHYNNKSHKRKNVESFVDKNFKDIDNMGIQFLPSVIITVASVIETDEIYSISENAAVVLNRPSPSFIGNKFNKIFYVIQEDQREAILTSNSQIIIELREHLMPDRVKKKTFRSSTRKKGEFFITLLIEEGIQSSNKPAYKNESISERLMNFIPTYYAKSFSDDNMSNFIFASSLLIFLRYDTSKSQPELERFFTMINMRVMNYTTFKIIKADGGIILFCGIKKMNKLIAYLFIRDIITEDINFNRAKPTNAPISFYIESFNSIRAAINTDDEPFLEIDINCLSLYETLLFKIEKYQVAFDCSLSNSIADIDQFAHQEQINFGNLSRSIKKISFDEYTKLFKEYL